MTVSKGHNKHIYSGNGVATQFPFDFDMPTTAAGTPDLSVIRVYLTDKEGRVTNVTAASNIAPGEVTYPNSGAAISPGEKLTILRVLGIRQQFFDPSNQSNIYPETLEDNTDRLVMMLQQQQEEIDRTLRVSVSESGIDIAADELVRITETSVAAAESAMQSKLFAQAAAQEAGAARDGAIDAVNDAIGSAIGQAATDASRAEQAADRAEQAEGNASHSADMASQYAHTAFAASAPPWSPTETYSYPDVVAYTDGMSYRCLGQGVIGIDPMDEMAWTRITITGGSFWEIDNEGNYMPAAFPAYDQQFELDNNGDIMPAAI